MQNKVSTRMQRVLWVAPWLVIVAFLVINARWLLRFRHGQPFDIDEAGYLSLALVDYFGLLYGGISGWISAIESPSNQAPLTMALASLAFYVGGPHPILGFAVPLIAGAGCIWATYMLGRTTGSRSTGLIAAVLVATCPVIVIYARSFHMSLTATFFSTLALVALLRSRGFKQLGWSALFGLCLGLMPLSRTMTIAFLPGMLVAAGVVVLVEPQQRVRRFFVLVGALLLAILVASTWLVPNGRLVANYLFGFGYGAQSVEYGQQPSSLGYYAWLAMLQAFLRDVYLPHFLAFATGGIVLLVMTLRRAASEGMRSTIWAALRSPAFPIAIVVAEAVVALTSSANRGSAFFSPVVPLMAVLTAFSWRPRTLGCRSYYVVTAGAMVILTVVSMVPLLDLRTVFATKWVVDLPILGGVRVTDGRGTLQMDAERAGYKGVYANEPIDRATGRAWVDISNWTATMISQNISSDAKIAFGFRNEFYNVNTVNLSHLIASHRAFAVWQVEPTVTGQTVKGFAAWLETGAKDACLLLTSNKISGDFEPAIDRSNMQAAARQTGFDPIRDWSLPDGQTVTMWKRGSRC